MCAVLEVCGVGSVWCVCCVGSIVMCVTFGKYCGVCGVGNIVVCVLYGKYCEVLRLECIVMCVGIVNIVMCVV